MKSRLSLKQIKEELEKKKTLDEKRKYLEEILKTLAKAEAFAGPRKTKKGFSREIKGAKLRAKIEELLKEIEKHIEHEEKFDKEKLEQKISAVIPEEIIPEKPVPAAKYLPKEKREPILSGLEKEVKSVEIPASKFVSFGPPTYVKLAGGDYMSFGEAADRAKLLLGERGLMKQMSADEFYRMSPVQKQTLMKTVSEAIGKPLEQYEQLYTITKSMVVRPEDKKYTSKRW